MNGAVGSVRTERLDLRPPRDADVDELVPVVTDPRLWGHFPSGRPTGREPVAADVARWRERWEADGLGVWIVRTIGEERILGYGGCALRRERFWNLSYRLAIAAQGRGYATELAREAVRRATALRPDAPVTALLLEHNEASASVVERLGFLRVFRGPDVGNPDASAVRLVYADRPLDEDDVAALLT